MQPSGAPAGGGPAPATRQRPQVRRYPITLRPFRAQWACAGSVPAVASGRGFLTAEVMGYQSSYVQLGMGEVIPPKPLEATDCWDPSPQHPQPRPARIISISHPCSQSLELFQKFAPDRPACAMLEARRRLGPSTETLDDHPALATCLICRQLLLVSLVHDWNLV